MLGMIFTEMVEMIEKTFSPEMADEILDEANLEHGGAYTAVGYYPFEEVVTLVTLLSQKTGMPVPALIEAFGSYLFNSFTKSHAQLLVNKHSLFDLLDTLDGDIHKEVYKLYPDAALPKFNVVSKTDLSLEMEYRSERNLQPLALGLMKGAADYFGHQQVQIEQQPLDDGATLFRVSI